MTPFTLAVLAALIFAAALFYSAVGNAGASGYLAVMALVGVDESPDEHYRARCPRPAAKPNARNQQADLR